jgi:hypothetical protein
MQRIGLRLVSITEHPYTRLAVGAALLVTGLDDLIEGLTGREILGLDMYHGVLVFAVQHILHALGDVFEGLERTGKHLVSSLEKD